MQKALYFMPDISGFTKFVNNMELEHSIHIISELLELLIDSNALGLELVEIEGDALFMFTSKIPSYEALLNQAEFMLEQFHKHTKNYETKRICNCGSCRTTTNLELKFIVHYGDLAFIKVKEFLKPYGSEVIKVHRLLKNKVPLNEYILFTNDAYEFYENEVDKTWEKASETYDLLNVGYFYKNLESIQKNVQVEFENNTANSTENSIPTLEIEKIIDEDIQNVYAFISELKYRHLWDKDIKKLEFDEHKVNRVGTEHNCVLNMGNLKFETITNSSTNDFIYGESTKDMLFTKNFFYFIELHKIDERKTALKVSLYLELSTIGAFMKSTMIKAILKAWNNKLEQLQVALKNKNQLQIQSL